jgi:WD40 repeat protein
MIKQTKIITPLLLTLFFTGCLWIPPTKKHAVSEKDLNSIVIGRSTKKELYEILGKPNRLEHDKYYVYDVEWSYGFLIIAGPQSGESFYLSGKQYRILLEFDESDILRNYDIEKGKFIYNGEYGVVSKSALLNTHKTVLLWEKPITWPYTYYSTTISGSCGKQLLAIGKKREPIWLINLETIEKVQLKKIKDVKYLKLSPDGRYLAYVSNSINVLDSASGQQVSIFKGHDVRFFLSSTPVLDFFPDGNKIASGGHYGLVRIWETITGVEINSFKAYEGSVGSIAVSPDGKMLATAGGKSIILWDPLTGSEFDRIKSKDDYLHRFDTTQLPYLPFRYGLKFSPTGNILAINKGTHVELIRINKKHMSFEKFEDVFLLPFGGPEPYTWRFIDFSKDGRHIAASNGSAIVWDIERRQKIWRHVVNYKEKRSSRIHAIAFCRNNELLVAATRKGVFLIQLQLLD